MNQFDVREKDANLKPIRYMYACKQWLACAAYKRFEFCSNGEKKMKTKIGMFNTIQLEARRISE